MAKWSWRLFVVREISLIMESDEISLIMGSEISLIMKSDDNGF